MNIIEVSRVVIARNEQQVNDAAISRELLYPGITGFVMTSWVHDTFCR